MLQMSTCSPALLGHHYRCPDCDGGPTTTQQLFWYDAKSPHTKAYEKYILLQLVHTTIEDVSIKEGLGAKYNQQ
jgi:hypothetical protein